jgi:7-cyano-7-deazaguanine synthase
VARLALATLAGNPFPDARPAFLSAMSAAVSLGLDHVVEVVTPYSELHKDAVIRLGRSLGVDFDLTLSCMNPADGEHCGACSKCRERQQAFAAAGVEDTTRYRDQKDTGSGIRDPG